VYNYNRDFDQNKSEMVINMEINRLKYAVAGNIQELMPSKVPQKSPLGGMT